MSNEFTLDEQRQRVCQLLDNSGKRELIKQCVMSGEIVLKPDLDISCNVGAQTHVLNILQAFNQLYLRLVLEAVLKFQIDYTSELDFMENLDKIAHKHIFHSPAILKNKKYVYTRGNWLTEEGKKAVERHFLQMICQIFYLMEQCVLQRVIPNDDHMFMPSTAFSSMHDVFSYMSRELIGGKTLFPRVMENIGFKPSHHDPDDLHSSFSRPCQSGSTVNQVFHSAVDKFKTTPGSSRKPSVRSASVDKVNDRIQQRLLQEAQDSRVGELFNQIDQSEMNSFLSQTQATVENIEKHVRGLTDYQSSVQALYNQLKHTAKFLADIVHSLGLDDAQIELIMQKINQLQLDIQETGEISAKLAGETQMIVFELSQISMRIEQSMRQTVADPIQSSFVTGPQNSKAYEDLMVKNKALAAKNAELEERLKLEVNTLQNKIDSIQAEKGDFERQVDVLTDEKKELESQLDATTKAKKEFAMKYAHAEKLIVERDDELENRKHIIEELRIEAEKSKVPESLHKDIEDRLQRIYNTMSDVTNRMHEN